MITIRPLDGKEQTGEEMYRLIRQYSGDLKDISVLSGGRYRPMTELSLIEAHDVVRKIPYRRDIKPIEVVSRPLNIMRGRRYGVDCKKKAILLGSYLRENGYNYRLMSSSKRPDKRIHHVFPQVDLGGWWYNYDATYPDYKPFESKMVTKVESL